ncbi:MAG: hypothetical protein AB7P20_19365 [Rhizobiaceae bacterium]
MTAWLDEPPYVAWSEAQKCRAGLAFAHIMAMDLAHAKQFVIDLACLVRAAESISDR